MKVEDVDGSGGCLWKWKMLTGVEDADRRWKEDCIVGL